LSRTIVNSGRASVTDQFGRRVTGSNYRITSYRRAASGQLESAGIGERARECRSLSQRWRHPWRPAVAAAARPHAEAIYCYVFQYSRPAERLARHVRGGARREAFPATTFYERVYRSDLFRPTPRNIRN